MGIENTTVKGLNRPSLTGFGALLFKQFRNNNGLFVVINGQVICVHGHMRPHFGQIQVLRVDMTLVNNAFTVKKIGYFKIDRCCKHFSLKQERFKF